MTEALEDLGGALGSVPLPQAQAAAAGLEGLSAALREAKTLGEAIARDAGLTAEDDYVGWIPVLILLYRFVYPPLKLALQIEAQVASVLEQLYSWLGGAGKAVDGFVSDVDTAGSDVVHFFESL